MQRTRHQFRDHEEIGGNVPLATDIVVCSGLEPEARVELRVAQHHNYLVTLKCRYYRHRPQSYCPKLRTLILDHNRAG